MHGNYISIDCYALKGRARISIYRSERARYYWPTRQSLARISRHVERCGFKIYPWRTSVGWNAMKEDDNA